MATNDNFDTILNFLYFWVKLQKRKREMERFIVETAEHKHNCLVYETMHKYR